MPESRTQPKLIVSDQDVDSAEREAVRREVLEQTKMGGDETKDRRFYDTVIRIILKRAKEIVPEGFGLDEVELHLDVDGKVFGTGIAGSIVLKLKTR